MKETFSQSTDFKNVNKYSLAIAVAKRAREIADKVDQAGKQTSEKSVELAIKDFKEKRCELVEVL